MAYYAVNVTSVIIAALLSKKNDTATGHVFKAMFDGRITPLYHKDILSEYDEVMHREKFYLKEETVQKFLDVIRQFGVEVFQKPTGETLVDMDNLIFYEVAMEKQNEGAFLVAGNLKRYPVKDFIVTLAKMVEILKKHA